MEDTIKDAAAPPWEPTSLKDISVEQKCRVFDSLHAQALKLLREKQADPDCPDVADPDSFFEAAFEGVLGEDVWQHW